MSHTQGKIKFRRGKEKEHEHDFIITGNRGFLIAAYSPLGYSPSTKELENHTANARRLVVCWNACIGIPTEVLEDEGESCVQVLTHHSRVVEQRDELLEALVACTENMEHSTAQGERAYMIARAAINKAYGKPC